MLPHENPDVDRRIRQLLKTMYDQAQQASHQPGPDFASMSYEAFQGIAPFIEAQFTSITEATFGPPPEGGGQPEHLEINGLNGNRVPVDVFRPMGRYTGLLPCVVYLHGGGMAFLSAKSYRPVLQHLANLGAVVVAPYFRNSPVARFPAGVHDCLAAVIWARDNLSALGASSVTVAGESGGACLALTVPLVALNRGLDLAGLVDGVWADSPICFNPTDPAGALIRKNDDPHSALELMMRRMYAAEPNDPCAFPMNATVETLRKFPRTVIVVYEVDPLRDEGISFYRKMLAAQHDDVDCMQLHGLTHAFMLARTIVPSFSDRQLKRLVAFAR